MRLKNFKRAQERNSNGSSSTAMSSLITQPENLTKDRLKAELKKQGVPFSPTQPKSYYVQLYRERMMAQKGSPARRPRSEFSSDEDVGRKAKQVRGEELNG